MGICFYNFRSTLYLQLLTPQASASPSWCQPCASTLAWRQTYCMDTCNIVVGGKLCNILLLTWSSPSSWPPSAWVIVSSQWLAQNLPGTQILHSSHSQTWSEFCPALSGHPCKNIAKNNRGKNKHLFFGCFWSTWWYSWQRRSGADS